MDNIHSYEIALVELAQLMANGQSESTRAFDLRAELASLEYELNTVEIEFVNNLSSDLYMIEDNEILDPVDPEMKWCHEYTTAVCNQAWIRALELLRYEVPGVVPVVRAQQRAYAYKALGFEVAAKAFEDFSFTVER